MGQRLYRDGGTDRARTCNPGYPEHLLSKQAGYQLPTLFHTRFPKPTPSGNPGKLRVSSSVSPDGRVQKGKLSPTGRIPRQELGRHFYRGHPPLHGPGLPSNGDSGRVRTCDSLVNSQVLFRLSYGTIWYSRPGSNRHLNLERVAT